MAAMLRSRAYVAHHGYQRQLRVCTPTRHVAHAGFAEGAAEATGAPNTQPEGFISSSSGRLPPLAAEEVAQLRTKLAAAECVAAHGLPLIITGEWETQQRPRVRLRGASFFRVGARRLCGS
eukprot:XP_001694338.1 predicted protein [Chlamydomonas reinhardtii]